MKMKLHTPFVLVALCAGLVFMNGSGIGGCGGGGASSGGGGSGSSDASVSSLSTVPSLDISNLDYSQSSSSSSALSAGLVIKDEESSSGDDKGLGHGFNQVGSSSRAGCESNMHKREMVRHSQESQLDRCYPEAMEAAGLITIPSGSYGYFKVSKPKEFSGDGGPGGGGLAAVTDGGPCAGIPSDRTDQIEACESGTEGPSGGEIKLRIGRFDSELRVDVCGGDAGLVNEGTYSANGSIYSITATRIGRFNGNDNKGTFSATVDLGTTGAVTDGIVTLGDGLATADAQMSGGFGSGSMHFEAVGEDKSNIIRGVFIGGFKDPKSGLATSFTGRVYTHFGGSSNVGTAKFEFTGAPPPMPLSNMIPFNIGPGQRAGFLQTLSMQLGMTITEANVESLYMCPNPAFDPQNPNAGANQGVAPMVQADPATGCASVTHTGVESFSIANGDDTVGDVSTKTQVFTIIANSGSTFFTEVNAFDLSTISNSSGTIAFSRNWDCDPEGSFIDIDFSTMTNAQKTKIRTGIQTCRDLETKVHANNGMGEYNCNEQQQKGDMNNMADNGPPPQGLFGGNCRRTATTCASPGREFYFFNPKDPNNNKYCLVSRGACTEFTVVSGMATGITDPDGVTKIEFIQPPTQPAVGAHILLTVGGKSCTAECTLEHPNFDRPPEFDPTKSGGDTSHGGPPEACVTAFGNPPAPPANPDDWFHKCQGLCSSKPDACKPAS